METKTVDVSRDSIAHATESTECTQDASDHASAPSHSILDLTSQEHDTELDPSLFTYFSEDTSQIESDHEEEIDTKMCIECRAHVSQVFCEQCHDHFCQLCFSGQHRKGNRKLHTFQLCQALDEISEVENPSPMSRLHEDSDSGTSSDQFDSDDDSAASDCSTHKSRTICHRMGSLLHLGRTSPNLMIANEKPSQNAIAGQNVLERAKYIPLRLSYEERKQLRLVEAALSVCQYTDKLDTIQAMENPSKRVRMQLQEIYGFLTGLVTASDYRAGQRLLQDKKFDDHEPFLQDIFELGRRYKIMNPEKMRGEYGKLMYLLQDAASPKVEELLGLSLKCPIKTVYDVLCEGNVLELLSDSKIELATMVISPDGKTRSQIQKQSRVKQQAIREITKKYAYRLDADLIEQCLYSIADNNYHLYFERDPIDRMIELLREHFDLKSKVEDRDAYSLAIERGQDGARLSHTHTRQFHYVLQSLTLWREVSHDMFRLWYLTDQDLLSSENQRYKLSDTGQGVHRIQSAPLVSRAMHIILHTTQCRLGLESWVGSSVIHLGDKNVPNALLFIDKYTQVGHILRPIVKTIQRLPELASQSQEMKLYIQKTFGGITELQKCILADFFREAFDGSGGDNFFDAGSCIDGRLTSAWNWCSNLQRKPFFPIFKIAGFVGFDGKFT